MVTSPGWRWRSIWCAAATISSSPSWVLAATQTERAVALAVLLRPRQAKPDPREERAGDPAEAVPAAEGALRHPRIDEDLRNSGAGELHDGHRPQLRFDEQGEIRPPVAEEAADPGRDVDRRKLVHRACRQPACRDIGGSDGDRGEDDRDTRGDDPVDERHHGVGLADACRMHPG